MYKTVLSKHPYLSPKHSLHAEDYKKIGKYKQLKILGKNKNAGKVNAIAKAFLTNNRKLFQTAKNSINALNKPTANNSGGNKQNVNTIIKEKN